MSHRRISNSLHVNGRLLPEQRLFDFKLKTASPDTECVTVLYGWFLECRRIFSSIRAIVAMHTKISLTELVNGLVLLILPIYFNALDGTTVLGITGYL